MGHPRGANLSLAVPSRERRTALEWCDEIGEYSTAERKRWNAVNETCVFDTNDPQLDLAPLCRRPAAGLQSAELWARWRQMDEKEEENLNGIDMLRDVFTPDTKQHLLEQQFERGQSEI